MSPFLFTLGSQRPVVLKHDCASESPGGLVKEATRAPVPEFLLQQIGGGTQQFVFLTNSESIQGSCPGDHTLRTTGLGFYPTT